MLSYCLDDLIGEMWTAEVLLGRNFFVLKLFEPKFLVLKLFCSEAFLSWSFFLSGSFFEPELFWAEAFFDPKLFWAEAFFEPKLFWAEAFLSWSLFELKLFLSQNFFELKPFWAKAFPAYLCVKHKIFEISANDDIYSTSSRYFGVHRLAFDHIQRFSQAGWSGGWRIYH